MIYFDNAATSFPKPISVQRATADCIRSYCANAGRSSHAMALRTAEEIYAVREKLASLMHFEKAENICFTTNATYALNIAIKTLISSGAHVLISDLEHNSVLRPIEKLRRVNGISYSVFSSIGDIEKNIEAVKTRDTKAIVSTLMSNVSGDEIPIDILSRTAKKLGLLLITDASQLIGHKPIDLASYPCDALCAPGHKGLFGIQGVGFVCFGRDTLPTETFIEGGSGSESVSLKMPDMLPERIEGGTLPTPSIISLGAGIDYINEIGLDYIENRLNELTVIFNTKLQDVGDIEIISAKNGIIAIRGRGCSNSVIEERLQRYDICTRSGLQCAPLAHKRLGTLDSGVIRISLSVHNTEAEADILQKALYKNQT